MAGFVVAPNTLKVLFHFTLHGRPQLNVLHGTYTAVGPLNPNLAENVWTAFKASAASQAATTDQFSTSTVWTGIGIVDLRSANNPEIISTTASLAGTGVGVPVPDQASIVVTVRTSLTGRSHRGRVYTAGYAAASNTAAGTISDPAAAAALTLVTALSNAMSTSGLPMAVLSPALPARPAHGGGELPAKPFELTPMSSLVVRDRIWDTNRRRLDTLHR